MKIETPRTDETARRSNTLIASLAIQEYDHLTRQLETKLTELAAAVGCDAGLGCCPHCHKTSDDQDPHSMERAVTATHYEPGNSNVVQCNWCGLSGPIYGTMDEAVEAWNKLPRHQWPEETTGSKALADVRAKHPNIQS